MTDLDRGQPPDLAHRDPVAPQARLLPARRLAPGRPAHLLPAHRGRLRQHPHGRRGQQPEHLRLPALRPDLEHQRHAPARAGSTRTTKIDLPLNFATSSGSSPTSRGRRSAGPTRSTATRSAASGGPPGPGPTSWRWKAYPSVESELFNVHGLNHKINFEADYRDACLERQARPDRRPGRPRRQHLRVRPPLLRPDQLRRRHPARRSTTPGT